MSAPTAIIADDEKNLRDYLRDMLSRHWPELMICEECRNGEEALDALQKWQPDFAFLDIKMPAMSGLEVAQKASGLTHVVFVTAYDEYAIAAFENNAIDYLLKPVSSERLLKTIERAKARLSTDPTDLSSLLETLGKQIKSAESAPRYLQWIKATRRGQVNLIAVDDVDYFQSANKYTSVFTKDGEWIIRTPLKELETRLDPDKFWRIHRSVIVRAQAIEQFKRTFAGRPVLKLHSHDKPLPVSRRYEGLFKAD